MKLDSIKINRLNPTEKDLREQLRDINASFKASRLKEGAIETALAALITEKLKGKYFQLKSYNEGQFVKVIERDVEHQSGFKCLFVETGLRRTEICVRIHWLSARELDDSEMADEIPESIFLGIRDQVLALMTQKISEIQDGAICKGEIILRKGSGR